MAAARSLQLAAAVLVAFSLASQAAAQDPTLVRTGRLPAAGDVKARQEHPFEVQAGQRIEVKLSSEEFDTYLELIPPESEPFYRAPLTNDDGEDGTNSQLTAVASAAGSWRAVVSAYETGEGAYRLEIFLGEAGQIQNVPTRPLSDSDSVSIKGRRYAVHSVTLDGNAQLLIEMASQDFSPMIIAEGPDGSRHTSEAGAEANTARLDIPLPDEGRWRIVATQATPEDALGDYALRMIQIPMGGREGIVGSLDASDPVDLEGEHYDFHRIEASPDRPVVLTLTSSAFDAFLAARSPSGEWLRDDDGGGDTSARLELPRGTGTWHVFVTSYSGGETGSYRLTITR